MTVRTVDLSGFYRISAITSGRITLASPATVNPAWFTGGLDGTGTTTVSQNITMRRVNSDQNVTLDGQYTITAVSPTGVTLSSPASVTTDWNRLTGYINNRTQALSASVAVTNNGNWIGPFIVEDPNTEILVVNMIAEGGLYKDDGKHVQGIAISFEVEATPVDLLDTPVGAAQTFTGAVDNADNPGDKTSKTFKAKTLVCGLSTPGRQSVRARRTTAADYKYKGTIIDEIKWQDLYGMGPVPQPDFGNVTTVHVRNYATASATSVKERKINMLVTRKLPTRVSGSTFTTALTPTNNVADILSAICLDPRLGNRNPSEVDFDNIYDTVAEVSSYFGTPEAAKFNYTFDKNDISFEEMVTTIAEAIFCTAYRRGSQLKLFLEKATPDSSVLFNHRNKVPGTETRTIRFGNHQDNDGLVYRYIDPVDDIQKEIKLPATGSVNPKTVDSVGVRSTQQATLHANRLWNKMQYQNATVQFDGLQEADILLRGERFLVADNTRLDTWDGEIVAQTILQLTLSQPFIYTGALDHSIFIQHVDGTIESIPIASVDLVDKTKIVLSYAPRLALAIGDNLYHNAAYEIAGNSSTRSSAFVLTERESNDNFTSKVTAINYDARYYQNDQDFA